MKREDIFTRIKRESDHDFIVRRLEVRTRKITLKDRIIYPLNTLAIPFGFDRKKDTIAVFGDRLSFYVQELAEYYNIISIGGVSKVNLMELWKKGVHSITYRTWHRRMADGFINDDWDKVDKEIAQIEKLFKRNNVKFLIVTDLYPVIQRAVCLAAKNLNIPIAYYEHTSLVNLKEDAQICEFYQTQAKNFTDFFWYWSEKNSKEIIGRNIANEDNSTIIGYPYKINRLDIEKKKSVLWIGDGETHLSETPEVYYKIVEEIFEYCKKNEIDFLYRPHPKEKKYFYEPLLEKGMQLSTKSLAEELEGNLVVLGGKTTVILEAGLYEDITCQILWDKKIVEPFLFDNAYVLAPDIEKILKHIQMALNGEVGPKPVEEYSLAITDLKNATKAAIEKNIRQYEGKE